MERRDELTLELRAGISTCCGIPYEQQTQNDGQRDEFLNRVMLSGLWTEALPEAGPVQHPADASGVATERVAVYADRYA